MRAAPWCHMQCAAVESSGPTSGPAHMQAGWTNQSWPSHLQSGMQDGLGREKSKGRESGSQARS